ncbi:MBL fold metallo-hydrolase [Candidatus Thorarchaeota archaeon]|nr:MAG: MBL fold metallo-hydrolase [Candidatus Thorarchaeota archaeon]
MLQDYPIHSEIQENIYLLRGKNASRFPQANSILIDDELLTLIDAGTHIDHIEHALRDIGHSLLDIDQIVLTHFHIDHKGHAEQIRQVSDCEVICHPLAEEGIATFEGMVDYYGIKGHKFFPEWNDLLSSFLPHIRSNYKVTGHFEDRRPIDCGSIQLMPIYTPGHTIDHTVMGIGGYDVMLLVDIDLTSFGPWYGNAVSDIQDFKKSMETIIELEPTTGISSHLLEPVSGQLDARLNTYLDEFDQRENRILEYIRSGKKTIQDLANKPTIYPRFPNKAYRIFEEFMIRKHIEDMERRNILSVCDGKLSVH